MEQGLNREGAAEEGCLNGHQLGMIVHAGSDDSEGELAAQERIHNHVSSRPKDRRHPELRHCHRGQPDPIEAGK